MNSGDLFITLSSGFKMPLVGIGTFKIYGRDIIHSVIDESLDAGYRLIDTAAVYRNESDIGHALNISLPKHNLKREDIFITTKLSPSVNGNPDGIRQAVKTSLAALGTDYIDLYLIHWPGASGIAENSAKNPELRMNTWKTLVDLQKQGLLRSIGVSNYTVNHLEQLLSNCYDVLPAVNQVECHPHFRQEELKKYCDSKGIHIQAYSSLGTSNRSSLLSDPTIKRISSELGVSPARVLLRWALQQDISVIPKAAKKDHIKDNIKLNFTLSDNHMRILSNLPQQKYAWDPVNVY